MLITTIVCTTLYSQAMVTSLHVGIRYKRERESRARQGRRDTEIIWSCAQLNETKFAESIEAQTEHISPCVLMPMTQITMQKLIDLLRA